MATHAGGSDENEMVQNTQKVIVLTLVCSERMKKLTDKNGKLVFDILKEFVSEEFNNFVDIHNITDVILGLNIMQGNIRVKNNFQEENPNKIWKLTL